MGDLAIFNLALLDTGSEWCVLPPALARDLGLDTASDASTPRLLSRFGAIAGRLERVPITFHASEGENLTIEATCFVSADWPGPLVIGWKGCLERMRFAFDPGDDSFYFGEL
jgi:hypothetical protein